MFQLFHDDNRSDSFSAKSVSYPLLCFLFQVSAYHDKFVLRQLKSFIQPVIDWEAGLVGRLASIMNTNASSQFQLNFEKFVRFILHELQTNMQSYGSLHW